MVICGALRSIFCADSSVIAPAFSSRRIDAPFGVLRSMIPLPSSKESSEPAGVRSVLTSVAGVQLRHPRPLLVARRVPGQRDLHAADRLRVVDVDDEPDDDSVDSLVGG